MLVRGTIYLKEYAKHILIINRRLVSIFNLNYVMTTQNEEALLN